jgi:excisionase family DNA binding protein
MASPARSSVGTAVAIRRRRSSQVLAAAVLDAALERRWEPGGGVTAVHVAKQDLRPFFTPKTLADYLSISERTVREMLSKQRIPSYEVEGQRRINPVDVEEYLARNRNGAA